MIEDTTRCEKQKSVSVQIMNGLTGEKSKEKRNKMSTSIKVYYEASTKRFSVYVDKKMFWQAVTDKFSGFYFELTEAEAQELSLKLAMEKQMGEMTQQEIDREQVVYDEMQQMARDSQP